MAILTYSDIYRLSEESQQMVGSSLQGAASQGATRFYLDFRLQGNSRTLVIDLTAGQPFFLSIPSTGLKGKLRNVPVVNFLKAHFINWRLWRWEVAAKPNRCIKLGFSNGIDKHDILFECFPHGRLLTLSADGKTVQAPRRSLSDNQDQGAIAVSFVEPQEVRSWEFNETLAGELLKQREGMAQNEPGKGADKRREKLERSLKSLEEALPGQQALAQEEIARLEAKAQEMKTSGHVDGKALDALYEQIKKWKRKSLAVLTRRNDLLRQMERFTNNSDVSASAPGTASKRLVLPSADPYEKKIFPGLRILIDESWQLWVGRNAQQNDELLKIASPHDLWIHLRDYAGAHGILRGPKKSNVPVAHIEFACRVVALLSQSKKKPFSEGEPLDFIVTPRKFVKKPRGAPAGRVVVERESVRRIAFKAVNFQAG